MASEHGVFFSSIISEMLPEMYTVEKGDFLKLKIHSQVMVDANTYIHILSDVVSSL